MMFAVKFSDEKNWWKISENDEKISVKFEKKESETNSICEKAKESWIRIRKNTQKMLDNMNEYDLDPELCECTR